MVYPPGFLEKLPSVDFSKADAKRTEITYYLFKNSDQTTAINLTEDYVFSEEEKNLPTKILMHGYTSNVTSPWYKELKNRYFEKGPHNIIYIDWSVPANKSFVVSAANIKPVGEYIADFIVSLQIPLENLHLIGHSLGSHLAGFIGKNLLSKTGKRCSRITATDPAGPGFEKVEPEKRLNTSDANFVDIIHTNVGYFGMTKAIGHVDFYANSGSFQPGCPPMEEDGRNGLKTFGFILFVDNCSHARSNEYFIESINKNVLAQSATFNEKGQVVAAQKTEQVQFGDGVSFKARGMFHFRTNSQAPFLINSS